MIDISPARLRLIIASKKTHSNVLAGARYREGMTQAALAEATGIPRQHISEMENGRRPIGKKNAQLLAEVLKIDPRRLLRE